MMDCCAGESENRRPVLSKQVLGGPSSLLAGEELELLESMRAPVAPQ